MESAARRSSPDLATDAASPLSSESVFINAESANQTLSRNPTPPTVMPHPQQRPMTGEDFQYINSHPHGGAAQMVEAGGGGGFQHSHYSPKQIEADVGNPYYIADKTMTELSSLPPPYEQIDGSADHVSSAAYEASAMNVAVAGMRLNRHIELEIGAFHFTIVLQPSFYPSTAGREDTLSQAMSIALVNDQCNSSGSNSGYDVANWSGEQGEFMYQSSTYDLSMRQQGGGVEMGTNG